MGTIRNPIEWSAERLVNGGQWLGEVGRAARGEAHGDDARITVHRITTADLRAALAAGMDDLMALRSDVIALCLLYPVVGLLLATAAFNYTVLPLLFPTVAGFAILGPFFAVGLYELSRRREKGLETGWRHALDIVASPSFGAIMLLGLGLLAMFVVWILLAQILYDLTLGPAQPISAREFAERVLTEQAGWVLTVVGIALGGVFALVALIGAAISFPLMVDRDVGVRPAVAASIRLFRENPVTVLTWGAVVAGLLALGMLPAFLGLVFVLPLLGHATWHLYRRAVTVGEPGAGHGEATGG